MEPQAKRIIFWAANFLALLGWISVNMYLPALPALEQYFKTDKQALTLSITLFLLGFSVSQFFWGSLSERIGRRKAIIYGLCVAALGTLMALSADNIRFFDTARLLEGVGIGAASVLTRALLSDAFDRTEMSRAFSYITTSANIMPAVAPIIGGYLLLWFDWHAIFIFLLAYTGLLLWIFSQKIHESHREIKPNFALTAALKEYGQVVRHRPFLGYLLPYVLMSGGMLGYYSVTPFIFITTLHISPQHYAFLSLATVASYILGANLSPHLAHRMGFNRTLLIGITLGLAGGILLLSFGLLFEIRVWTVIVPMMFYTLGAGIVAPTANASAMNDVRHIAGAASAISGASVYACSAVLTAVIAMLNMASQSSLAFYVIAVAGVGLLGFKGLIKRGA